MIGANGSTSSKNRMKDMVNKVNGNGNGNGEGLQTSKSKSNRLSRSISSKGDTTSYEQRLSHTEIDDEGREMNVLKEHVISNDEYNRRMKIGKYSEEKKSGKKKLESKVQIIDPKYRQLKR